MPVWESKIFAGTTRDWWVYVPAQYKPEQAAAVMVFQDGHDYVNLKGNWRAPIVFDNLIASGEMPVTIGDLHQSRPRPEQRRAEEPVEREQSQPRIQFARRPLRAVSPRGNPARSREDLPALARPGTCARICGASQRRHRGVHGGLGATG